MAEIIDEYIALDDRIPAPNADVEENSSEQPNAFSRFGKEFLSTYADQGSGLYAGLLSAFYPEEYQKRQQQRANASRMAELQLQQAELNFEQAQTLAPLQVQQAKANLANAERQGRNADQLFEQRSQLHPLQMQGAEADADFKKLRFQQLQQQSWTSQAQADQQRIDAQIKSSVGYDLLDDSGRAVYDNSPQIKALSEATVILRAFQNDPEKGKYLISQMGWSMSTNDNGEDILVSPDGKHQFRATPEGIKSFMATMQQSVKDDITAARVLGTDAANLPQFAAKTIMRNPGNREIYGTESNLYKAYSNFIRQKIQNRDGQIVDLFSSTDKMGHALSVTLNAALEDNALSQEEMQVLTPMFAGYVKQMGGEVKFGQGIDDTTVIIGRNSGVGYAVPLRQFAKDIAQRDKIAYLWDRHCQEVAAKMQKNQSQQNADGETRTQQQQNIVDFYGEPPEGVTIETHGSLGDTFSAGYRDLDDTQRAALAAIYEDWIPRYFQKRDKNGKIIPVDLKEMSEKDRLNLLRQANTAWKDNIINAELPDRIFSPIAAILYQEEMKALNPEIESLKKEILAKYPNWGKAFFEEYGKGNFDIDKFAKEYAGPADRLGGTPNFPKVISDPDRTNFDKNLRPKINKYIKLVNQYEDRSKWLREITDIQQNGLKED